MVWTPVRDHSFYASYSKTFSPTGGGTIGITPNARGNTNDLDPEHTRQYEAVSYTHLTLPTKRIV